MKYKGISVYIKSKDTQCRQLTNHLYAIQVEKPVL